MTNPFSNTSMYKKFVSKSSAFVNNIAFGTLTLVKRISVLFHSITNIYFYKLEYEEIVERECEVIEFLLMRDNENVRL